VKVEIGHSLVRAFSLSSGDVVSVVGAGGKTSLIYSLADELVSDSATVLVTTTTKMAFPDRRSEAVIIAEESSASVNLITQKVMQRGFAIAARARSGYKIIGYSPSFIAQLATSSPDMTLLVECDGARGKSLKGPKKGEPPVPDCANLYVVVVGGDCLGEGIDSELVFNPRDVAHIACSTPECTIDASVIHNVILNRHSYLGSKPDSARMCVFLSKIEWCGKEEDGKLRRVPKDEHALRIGLTLASSPSIERVVIGDISSDVVVLRS